MLLVKSFMLAFWFICLDVYVALDYNFMQCKLKHQYTLKCENVIPFSGIIQ